MATIENNANGFVLIYTGGDLSGSLYAAYLYADTEDLSVTIEIGSIVWRPDQTIWANGQGNAIANRLNSQDPREHFPYVIFTGHVLGGDGLGGYIFTFQGGSEDFNFRVGSPSGGGEAPPLEPPSSPFPDPAPADTAGLIAKRKREVPVGRAERGEGQSGVIPTAAKYPKRVIA